MTDRKNELATTHEYQVYGGRNPNARADYQAGWDACHEWMYCKPCDETIAENEQLQSRVQKLESALRDIAWLDPYSPAKPNLCTAIIMAEKALGPSNE